MREVRPALPNLALYLVGDTSRDAALSVEAAAVALREAAQLYGANHVRFVGEAACRHPELASLIDAAVSNGFTWQPSLDGCDISAFAALLTDTRRPGLLLPSVTLDSSDESVHDSARGAGRYRKALQALTTMAALGIPTEVRIELHRLNQATLEQTAMLALKLGADRLVVSVAMPSGSPFDALLAMPQAAVTDLASRANRLAEVLAIDVDIDPSLAQEPPLRRCEALDGRWLHFGPDDALVPCAKHVGHGAPAVSSCALNDGIATAHLEMLAIAERYYSSRLADLHAGARDGESPCSRCLRLFGSPHWQSDGHGVSANDVAGGRAWRQDWAQLGAAD